MPTIKYYNNATGKWEAADTSAAESVKFVPQVLEDAEKKQARDNIGAMDGKTKIPTKTSDLTNDSGFINKIPSEYVTDNELQPKLDAKVNKAGDTMTGDLNMGGNVINNLPKAIENAQPVTFEQLNEAIAGLGTVFDLKGSKPNKDALPPSGNTIGDVWYVEDEEVGYIWIEKNGVPQWERFGAPIDLSGYLQIVDLADGTGISTVTAMTQKATTDELNKKAKFTIVRRW